MTKNEPPKRLRKEHRRCNQTQCSFYIQGGCKSCEKCKARPYEINTACSRCLACENIPDALRWDNGDNSNSVAEANSEKALLEMVKMAIEQEIKNIENGQERKESPIIIQR